LIFWTGAEEREYAMEMMVDTLVTGKMVAVETETARQMRSVGERRNGGR
jgi:hypothetical protein